MYILIIKPIQTYDCHSLAIDCDSLHARLYQMLCESHHFCKETVASGPNDYEYYFVMSTLW